MQMLNLLGALKVVAQVLVKVFKYLPQFLPYREMSMVLNGSSSL